jgi:hypothetical protein
MKEPAAIESSVSFAECLSQEAFNLLARVQSTLVRIRDTYVPDSTSDTMAGVLEALAVKADGEDPLFAAVCR